MTAPRLAGIALTALVLAAGAQVASAVNLVPNPSFETLSTCPPSFSSLYVATPWDAPTTGTSDALNACAVSGPFPPNVPSNVQGYQNARTGVGMAGFILYSASVDYREYLYAPLTSTLAPGQPYAVSFWISLADASDTAVDRIGAYLSSGPVGPVPNWFPLPVTPQVESPTNTFLNDKLNWVQVSGTYVATGTETHIVIGSFHDDATTNLQSIAGTWPGAYYFVDDVSVEPIVPTDQACCLPDGQCAIMLPGECQALGGNPLGPGSTCTPNACDVVANRPTSWGAIKSTYR